jgi:hypothetical protein
MINFTPIDANKNGDSELGKGESKKKFWKKKIQQRRHGNPNTMR